MAMHIWNLRLIKVEIKGNVYEETVDSDYVVSRAFKKFESVINEEQPDIVMTYNGFGFDNKFLMTRVKQLLIEHSFGYISKMKKTKTELKIKRSKEQLKKRMIDQQTHYPKY